MELFILLVLSFCCCHAVSHGGREVDCDDPQVFNAVDLALQTYNDRKEGNQFALVQVLEAREIAGPGTNLLVTYRLKETTCAVGHGRWQDCKYSTEGDSGRCVAKVQHLERHPTVSQTCTILRAPEKVFTSAVVCLGCWYPVSNDSLALQPIVRYTMEDFNNKSNHISLFDVGAIGNAQRQVVNGWKYRFDYLIKQTNCTKTHFSKLGPQCKPIPGGETGRCKVLAYVNSSDILVYATQDCAFLGMSFLRCFGCQHNIAIDDPDMLQALDVALEKYNNESSDSFYYIVDHVTAATSQIVAGINYRVVFTLIRSNCSKDQFPKVVDDCTAAQPSKLLNCRSTIYVVPWESLIFPAVTCTKIMKELGGQKYIPGLTPSQTAKLPVVFPENKRRVRRSQAHTFGHKHGHKKHHSSLESQEETIVVPGTEVPDQPSTLKPIPQEEVSNINPAGGLAGLPNLPWPDSNGVSPDGLLFESLSDLRAPKCPGKPWKPFTAPTPPVEEKGSPKHQAFGDFDLPDALP